jgi:hypothetical protein
MLTSTQSKARLNADVDDAARPSHRVSLPIDAGFTDKSESLWRERP